MDEISILKDQHTQFDSIHLNDYSFCFNLLAGSICLILFSSVIISDIVVCQCNGDEREEEETRFNCVNNAWRPKNLYEMKMAILAQVVNHSINLVHLNSIE